MRNKIITTAATRGGVAKTTTAHTLGYIAAEHGEKVLLIDLDPQATLTLWAGAKATAPGIYEVLTQGARISDIVQNCRGVDIAAANGNLSAITETRRGSIRRLAEILEPVRKRYNRILIDTPPYMGELQNIALYASDIALLTLQTDAGSLQALYTLTDIIKHINATGAHVSPMSIITIYEARPRVNRIYRDSIEEAGLAVGAPLIAAIPKSTAAREAHAVKEPLNLYAPKSKPAIEYSELYNYLRSVK